MLPDWSDECSVHHQIIDEQHKKLFELAHKAYRIANSPAAPSEIKAILIEFFDYMKVHFKDEEQYMAAIRFPNLESHKKIHRQIVADMAGMVKNVHSLDILKEMISTIAKDWLLTHILQEDMQIEKWRQEQSGGDKEVGERFYIYTCECPGKEHKLAESMHIFVSHSNHPINCKECHKQIKLKV